jgi:hypothetical protein
VGTAADLLVGQEAEPPLDLVDPGGAGRGEVHVEAWVLGQPGPDRGRLVGAVVVADQVDRQVRGHFLVDPDQELLELRCPVPAVQGTDDLAGGDVERGEQGGQPVADVVVVRRSGMPGIIGSTGWERSSAWICDFSSTDSTTAPSGGSKYRPTTS